MRPRLIVTFICLLLMITGCSTEKLQRAIEENADAGIIAGSMAPSVTPTAAPIVESAGAASTGNHKEADLLPHLAASSEPHSTAAANHAVKEASASAEDQPAEIEASQKPADGGKSAAQVNPTAKPSSSAGPAITDQADQEDQVLTVKLSIRGDAEHGIILPETALEYNEDDTVFDLLKRITRENRIQMEFRGRGAAVYIEGIDNLYEFDHGAESGWLYNVNGKLQSKSAGSCKLHKGDVIEWVYTESTEVNSK